MTEHYDTQQMILDTMAFSKTRIGIMTLIITVKTLKVVIVIMPSVIILTVFAS
jgi:hypothetical protein